MTQKIKIKSISKSVSQAFVILRSKLLSKMYIIYFGVLIV
jgi:hypothetical protein